MFLFVFFKFILYFYGYVLGFCLNILIICQSVDWENVRVLGGGNDMGGG